MYRLYKQVTKVIVYFARSISHEPACKLGLFVSLGKGWLQTCWLPCISEQFFVRMCKLTTDAPFHNFHWSFSTCFKINYNNYKVIFKSWTFPLSFINKMSVQFGIKIVYMYVWNLTRFSHTFLFNQKTSPIFNYLVFSPQNKILNTKTFATKHKNVFILGKVHYLRGEKISSL